MSSLTLNEQFIGSLKAHQRELIWEYYHLIISDDLLPKDEADKIAQVWEHAESDLILCKWLELIDYFCTDVSTKDEILSSDRRSYISEYLATMLSTELQDGKNDTETHQHKAGCVVFLECPDGTGTISIVVNDCFLNSVEGNTTICGSCGIELSKHKNIFGERSSSV